MFADYQLMLGKKCLVYCGDRCNCEARLPPRPRHVDINYMSAVVIPPHQSHEDPAAKWHRRFLSMAREVSTWSKDPSTKVGAVMVNDLREVVGLGYNGFPRGVADTSERLENREIKYEMVVHAEVNAMINAGHRARGATLYVWPSFGIPSICSNCCKAVIQAGVKRVVGAVPDAPPEVQARWASSIATSRQMCQEAGVEMLAVRLNAEGSSTEGQSSSPL